MKSNYSNEEIGKVVSNLSFDIKLNVRLNKSGNLTVTNSDTVKFEKWTLYRTSLGYLWRRHNLRTGYCYPLNMINRNILTIDKGHINYSFWCMNKHCTFYNIDDAINYFITYFKKHKDNYKF